LANCSFSKAKVFSNPCSALLCCNATDSSLLLIASSCSFSSFSISSLNASDVNSRYFFAVSNCSSCLFFAAFAAAISAFSFANLFLSSSAIIPLA